MSRGRLGLRLLTVLGALSLVGLSLVLAFAPTLAPGGTSGLRAAVADVAPTDLLVLLGLPAAVYLAWRYLKGRWWVAAETAPLVETIPEVSRNRDVVVAGADVDRALGTVGGSTGRTNVRADLRDLARDVVARRARCSTEEAARRVEAGTWTDDVRAAAYLGGEDAPPLPFGRRLADVLRTEPTERLNVRRALDAIEVAREGPMASPGGEPR